MMDPREDEHALDGADRSWVEGVATIFQPEPMDARRARAFEQRLAARIAPRARARWLAAPVLIAAAAALALWMHAQPPTPAAQGRPASTLHAFADPDAAFALVEPYDYLPDDYRALARWIEPEADAP